jgi:ribosomal protein S18 acetylase RimI-like enzyme
MRREEISLLEELNFNAWPALRCVHYDGWLLRSTGGDSRRVNSVNVVARSSLPLEDKIATAEAIYRRWGRKTIFRLTPLAEETLDDLLVARGYVLNAPTFVQLAELSPLRVPERVRIFARADDAWIAAALRIRGLEGEPASAFAMQHRSIGAETAWMLIEEAGVAAAVGVATLDRGWAGLHGIYVAREARRRGLARTISEALIGHAHAGGARHAWLQVEQTNAAALPLYSSLGFRTCYAYHHRVQGA